MSYTQPGKRAYGILTRATASSVARFIGCHDEAAARKLAAATPQTAAVEDVGYMRFRYLD